MSNCFKENVTPGSQTTVHGVVKDFRTGEIFPGVKVGITKQFTNLSSFGPQYTDYESVYTKADGTYTLTFIPKGNGDFSINIRDLGNKRNFFGGNNAKLVLGKENQADFSVYKVLDLKVHLINQSTQNKRFFDLNIDTCCVPNAISYYGQHSVNKVKTDTMLLFKVPQLAKIKTISKFYNSYYGSLDSISFRKLIQLNKSDTTITIINP